MNGLLIAFEGIDGCGKQTQLNKTRLWLESLGFSVQFSHEPNEESSPIGKTIKKILSGEMPMPEEAAEFQRLYVIDRAQDTIAYILPALRKGHIYLIERFALSTIAYGMLSGKPAEFFIKMHQDVIGSHLVWPHRNIILDVSAEEAIRRIAVNRGRPEYFERADLLSRIRNHYLALADLPEFRARTVVTNGERTPDEVFEDVKRAIEPILPARK